MHRNLFICLLTFTCCSMVLAQGSGLPLGNPAYHIVDRLEITTGISSPFHPPLKYFLRGDLTDYAIHLDTFATNLSSKDRVDLGYIFRDNNEWLVTPEYPTTLSGKKEPVFKKIYIDSTQTFYTITSNQGDASRYDSRYAKSKKPVFKHFYKTPANFFELDKKYFHFRLNPILNLKLGSAKDQDDRLFFNQRGLELRAGIDDRIFFYSQILETQARFPDYVNNRIERDLAVPGQGFYKNYSSDFYGVKNGYDFLNAQGYIGFNASRHVGLQLGHGRNFIGDGYRSMLLSDFSNNYFYLKLNTRVWKFHYQNLFAELNVEGNRDEAGDLLLPKKYMAAHYFSFKLRSNLTLGIYEAVIFNRNNHFELQYLNPIILYRAVEGGLGSPDNVLIGLTGRWDFLKRFSLYGQFLFDEFKYDELLVERRGWWANKVGIQAGIKYINVFGIDHLDAQAEFNLARPYTYTHRDSSASYSHYNQPLAHPLGANFQEAVFRLRYQPVHRLVLEGRVLAASFGEDVSGTNYGGNILLPNSTREMEYGNEIGQGIKATSLIAGMDISYQVRHNVFLDLHYFYRKVNSEDNNRDHTTQYISAGFRMNIQNRNMDF